MLTDDERQKLKEVFMMIATKVDDKSTYVYSPEKRVSAGKALAALDEAEARQRTAAALEKLVDCITPAKWQPFPEPLD